MVKDVLKLRINNAGVGLKVGSKGDEDNVLESINVLLPKFSSIITLEDKNRRTLGAEYIYNIFIESCYFDKDQHIQSSLRSIV